MRASGHAEPRHRRRRGDHRVRPRRARSRRHPRAPREARRRARARRRGRRARRRRAARRVLGRLRPSRRARRRRLPGRVAPRGRGGGGGFVPDDDEVGGMQGLIEPWARAIRARGGEIALGWKPVEIVVDGGRVHGAVAVNRANLVREVRAPVAISTYPVWENFELIDERLFPADFVAAAHTLKTHRADVVGWQAGLRRLPSIRSTGHPDDHPGWNRLVAGGEHGYRGGFQLTSLLSRRAAPPGRHQLSLAVVRFFRGGSTAAQPWTAAKAAIDDAVAYLHRFYADLDACH